MSAPSPKTTFSKEPSQAGFGRAVWRWLKMPFRECGGLMVFGLAAYFLGWATTQWNHDGWWVALPLAVVDLYVLGLVVCLLPKRIRQAALAIIYVLIYVCGFVESFLYQRYYMHITAQALNLVAETTPTESGGFIRLCLESNKFWLCLWWWGLLLVIQIATLIIRNILRHKHPQTEKAWRKWSPLVGLPIVLVCLIWWIPTRGETCHFFFIKNSDVAERTNTHLFYCAPWRLAYALKTQSLSGLEMQNLARNMQHLEAKAGDGGVDCIVFVIGESYNKHHSSVYGYPLPTTPFQQQMQREGNMVAFKDAVTPWNVTSNVFKQMLSTHSSDQKGRWTDGVLWPALFKTAGYRVCFFTNQFYKTNRQTVVNYNGSFFLNSEPFDSLCFDRRNRKHYLYDIGLLKELPTDTARRELVILHLLGQHQPYDERVPKGQGVFSEKDIHRKDLNRKQRMIVADYDNATRVNDYVMATIWDRYKNRKAVIVYLADHGEEVYDGRIGTFGRNHMATPTAPIVWAEFEVPLEVFVTPPLQREHPELIPSLQASAQRPFAIDDIGHLLMGLAKLNTPYYNERRDVRSPKFQVRPRPVKDGPLTFDQILSSGPAPSVNP